MFLFPQPFSDTHTNYNLKYISHKDTATTSLSTVVFLQIESNFT